MTGLQKRRPGQWITMIGFCVAMEVILARFLSLHTWNLKIGFSFLPVVAAALWGGPLAGGITGALGDLIGALLFPVGAYSPVSHCPVSWMGRCTAGFSAGARANGRSSWLCWWSRWPSACC